MPTKMPDPTRLISALVIAVALLVDPAQLAAQETQWAVGPFDAMGTITWDRATIVRQDENVLRVWVRMDYNSPQYRVASDSVPHLRVVARYDLDCTKRVSRVVQRHWYGTTGILARSSDQITAWAELVPDGAEAKTLALICTSQSGTRPPAPPSTAIPEGTKAPAAQTPLAAPAAQTPLPVSVEGVPSDKPFGQSGFRAAFGFGSGSIRLKFDGDPTDRDNASALMVSFGRAVTSNIVLRGEYSRWSDKNDDGDALSLQWGGLVAQFYPSQSHTGFYWQVGVGVATSEFTFGELFPGYYNIQFNVVSLGLQGGVGWDLPVSKTFLLTPFADYVYGAPANIQIFGKQTIESMVGYDVLRFGLAASWR